MFDIPSPSSPPSPGRQSLFPGTDQPNQKMNTGSHRVLELPSGRLRPGWLPQVMTTRDMTVLCLFSVLLVSNVPLIAGAGAAGYLDWLWTCAAGRFFGAGMATWPYELAVFRPGNCFITRDGSPPEYGGRIGQPASWKTIFDLGSNNHRCRLSLRNLRHFDRLASQGSS